MPTGSNLHEMDGIGHRYHAMPFCSEKQWLVCLLRLRMDERSADVPRLSAS